MSKKEFLDAARKPAEEVTLSNGQKVTIRKFTQGEFDVAMKAALKIEEGPRRASFLARKMVEMTAEVGGEKFTEQELSMGVDNDLVNEMAVHVSRINGLNKKAEDVEGG